MKEVSGTDPSPVEHMTPTANTSIRHMIVFMFVVLVA